MGMKRKRTTICLLLFLSVHAYADWPAGPDKPEEHDRAWTPLPAPTVSFNEKHQLIVLNLNANDVRVFHAADGKTAWQRTVAKEGFVKSYTVVMEDAVMISGVDAMAGYLYDIQTGNELGSNTGIPRPRSCAKVIGNSSLLAYRDAATELYDVEGNRMIECRYYYGGRSSLTIAGEPVEFAETKEKLARPPVMAITVEVDLDKKKVTLSVAGHTLTTRITGDMEAITHIGYGGSNFSNRFTPADL